MEDFGTAVTLGGSAPLIVFLVGLIKYLLPDSFTANRPKLIILITLATTAIWAGILWQSGLSEFENLATCIIAVLSLAASASGLRAWIGNDVLGGQVRELTGIKKAQ